MDKESKRKIVLIILAASIVFLFLMQPILIDKWEQSDAHRHQIKSNGCVGYENAAWNIDSCNGYWPLLGIVSAPFSGNPHLFSSFMFIIIGVATPLALFWLSKKNWISVLLYFTSTTYFFYMLEGFYAQAFVIFLSLILLKVSDWRIEFVLVLAMMMSQSQGLFLGVLILMVKYIPKTGFLSCSGVFGANTPVFLTEKATDIGKSGMGLTFGQILHVFTRIMPAPLLLLGVWQNFKDGNHGFNFIILVSIVGGFFIDIRMFYLMPLLVIVGLSSYYSTLIRKHRNYFVLILLGLGAFNVYSFWNVNSCLGFV